MRSSSSRKSEGGKLGGISTCSTTSYCLLGGSTALHEGVWLYLGAVTGVLDAWSDGLGLKRLA